VLDLFLAAMQQEGLGKILAEPTLVARSGELAAFLVGGEIPIPVVQGTSQGLNNVTVVFKNFGVNVEFTPTVLSPQRIHLQVAPEVSEPDFNFGTTIGGTTVPAFNTRRASTSVELADGQTFAIAGLLREDIRSTVEKIPALGELPVLGALFRSEQFQKQQTELVLLVTPHLVKPLDPGRPTLPTDHYIEPNDYEFYLLGRLEGRREGPLFGRRTGADAGGAPGEGLLGDHGYRMPVPAPREEGR
jgi:pilus assembly protein CpaC